MVVVLAFVNMFTNIFVHKFIDNHNIGYALNRTINSRFALSGVARFCSKNTLALLGQPTLNSMVRALIIKLDLTHNGFYNTVKFCG